MKSTKKISTEKCFTKYKLLVILYTYKGKQSPRCGGRPSKFMVKNYPSFPEL